MEHIKEKMTYDIAVQRVKELKKFYSNLLIFVIVGIALTIWKIQKTGEFDFYISKSIILVIWGALLSIKGIKLFLLNPKWEKRLINKELNKN